MTLTDLYIRAENGGIEVDDVPMRELKAVSFPDDWIAIDTGKIDTHAEEKVLLAHEIGHCETGSFYNIHSPFDLKEKRERRAIKRSYEILVPHDQLLEVVACGVTEIWDLAEHFDVPCEFMKNAAEYWRQQEMAG